MIRRQFDLDIGRSWPDQVGTGAEGIDNGLGRLQPRRRRERRCVCLKVGRRLRRFPLVTYRWYLNEQLRSYGANLDLLRFYSSLSQRFVRESGATVTPSAAKQTFFALCIRGNRFGRRRRWRPIVSLPGQYGNILVTIGIDR
jgi:hypothetical protein